MAMLGSSAIADRPWGLGTSERRWGTAGYTCIHPIGRWELLCRRAYVALQKVQCKSISSQYASRAFHPTGQPDWCFLFGCGAALKETYSYG